MNFESYHSINGINCEKMTPDIVKSKITKNMTKTGGHLGFFVIMELHISWTVMKHNFLNSSFPKRLEKSPRFCFCDNYIKSCENILKMFAILFGGHFEDLDQIYSIIQYSNNSAPLNYLKTTACHIACRK